MINDTNSEETNKFVGRYLMELGCPSKYMGYFFLKDGMAEALHNCRSVGCIHKTFYNFVACKYHTDPVNVARNIRTVLDAWWKTCPLKNMFITRPTNLEFIMKCTECIALNISTNELKETN